MIVPISHDPDTRRENASGHALQHHRGCLIEGDSLWQSHQPIGLYEPHLGIAAGRTGIGHPIADFQTAHIRGDCLYGPGAFEARDKGKRLRVVSCALIDVNVVEARRRLAQAHLTRPGLTDIDRCPVQNLGTAGLPNLDRMRHTDFRKNMNSLISSCKTENSTTSLLSRLWCHLSTILLFVGRTPQETPLLEDLRALVEFAQARSIAGAADRLFRTPSAITRQVQRLEAALGAELLDRSVKPPRLNSLGSRVLEQARDLLQRTEAL